MYVKIVVKLFIIKIDTSVDLKVGVKQRYSMALVLSLFLTVAFDEKLEDKWTALVLSKCQFAQKYNSPRSTGQLVIHGTGKLSSGNIFDLLCILYVDDGALVFESMTNIKRGVTLLSDHFSRFGL